MSRAALAGRGSEAIENEGDEMVGDGLAGDEVEIGESYRRTVVGDGEVGGLEVEDGLVVLGADDEVEGDFIDGGAEFRDGGRLRGRLGRLGRGGRCRRFGRLGGRGECRGQEEQGGWQSYTQGARLGPKLKHVRTLPGRDGSGTVLAEPEGRSEWRIHDTAANRLLTTEKRE